jgi:xanthine dehydrogenase accessory factor
MSVSLQRLIPLFERERAVGAPTVLATVVRTSGPTYTKPGAQMLICGNGEYAGLLSGGCLEGDLAEHGRVVLGSGEPRLVSYQARGPEDLIFGMGSGCEGAMDILLQRLDSDNGWQPMSRLAAAWREQREIAMALIVRSTEPAWRAGTAIFVDDAIFGAAAPGEAATGALRASVKQLARRRGSRYVAQAVPGIDLLWLSQPAPTQILLLGAGPDAQPVAQLAALLGWRTTVIDHRSHYARAVNFPHAAVVLDGGSEALIKTLSSPDARAISAAVVMSHHFAADLAYLRALSDCKIPYIGLLGPAMRRERLLTELGAAAQRLRPRLRAPVGLDIGAATPESIALSIVAEIHATLAGDANMLPMSRKQA